MHKFIIPNWMRANVKVEPSVFPIVLTYDTFSQR